MRILVVDDDRDVLDDFSNSLKPTGYEIVETDNPNTALELYMKKEFDVVISDVHMQGMSGIELLSKLHEFNPKVHVIIITAFGDLETAISAINNHAYAFFSKPINFTELIHTIMGIELELYNENKIKMDHSQLEKEYDKLKMAYNDLNRLLGKMRGNNFYKSC
jgi:DNA-binding NtrC family response regulator